MARVGRTEQREVLREASPEASYYEKTSDGLCRCLLCPRGCAIQPGETGHCGVRRNEGGKLVLPFHGLVSSIALDPVEKKPLSRYLSGSLTYSVGFWGCTMDCPFCQNWEISHPTRTLPRFISPERLVAEALRSGCPSISFTYSEPCLHLEYVAEAMAIAHEAGLKTILVTNGCLRPEPARHLLSLTDATNVDLKTADPGRYATLLGGDLASVQAFIAQAASLCHLEVTSLLVPGVLDDPGQIEVIARFLASISRDIPLHITPYHPAYLWAEAPLSREESAKIAAPAFSFLDHVYYHAPLVDRGGIF